jgi:hypothetical protein
MAKLTRKHQKVFAGSAANNGQFGSAQTGAKVTSTDLDTLQSLAAFGTGWLDAVISGQKLPPLEEFQALDHIATRQIAYIFQEGIPEWNTSCEYHQNSIVKKSGTYELYGSLINTNTGNALPAAVDNANWKYLGDLSNLLGTDAFAKKLFHATHQVASGTDGGTFTSGAWQKRTINTVLTNEIAGSSLASSEVVLPAGTYFIEAKAAVRAVSENAMRLYNVTDSTEILAGQSELNSGSMTIYCGLSGRFTIAGTKTIRLEHRCQTTVSSVGFGDAVGSSFTVSTEKFVDVKIWKV